MAAAYTTSDICNVALVGHAGAGKTMLTEALLFRAGVIDAMGSIDGGDTVSDFTPQEQDHGHSLVAAMAHMDVRGRHLNLIDTPGLPDFIGQAIGALPAVETVAVVINAATGIDPIARAMMARAQDRNLCRMIVVNHIDAVGVDLRALMEALRDTFGGECLPLNLPIEGGVGVVDCFFNHEDGTSDLGSIAAAHTAIIDQVVEVDEELALAYLEGEAVTRDQLHDAFEKALRQGHVIPVCFASADPHTAGGPVGIDALLDVLVRLAPSPREGNPRPFVRGADLEHEIHAEPDPDKHVLAHVFNVRVDPFIGKISAFRLHQGTINGQSQLYVDNTHGRADGQTQTTRKPIRVGHLFKLQGRHHVEIDRAVPGDLAATAKIDEIHLGAVLHDSHDEDGIHLRPLAMPVPLFGLAIEPKKRGDDQKIADALSKLVEEDPSFTVTRERATQETVIHGLGDLHLRVILERLKDQYHVEVDTKPPRIAYRETIQRKAQGHHRHKKQTGGAGQFGEVYLRVEPTERGSGFEFVDDTHGGSIPKSLMPAIAKGVASVLEEGAVAGYPIQDVKVSVYDGKFHAVDSKEIAFVTAGKRAFIDAIRKAGPILLEPMVELAVTYPSEHMGGVAGDLSGKRGRIQGTDMLAGDQALMKAVVPMSEMMNYPSQLKSLTGGAGSFTMAQSVYEPVPHHVQEEIVARYRPRDEED